MISRSVSFLFFSFLISLVQICKLNSDKKWPSCWRGAFNWKKEGPTLKPSSSRLGDCQDQIPLFDPPISVLKPVFSNMCSFPLNLTPIWRLKGNLKIKCLSFMWIPTRGFQSSMCTWHTLALIHQGKGLIHLLRLFNYTKHLIWCGGPTLFIIVPRTWSCNQSLHGNQIGGHKTLVATRQVM